MRVKRETTKTTVSIIIECVTMATLCSSSTVALMTLRSRRRFLMACCCRLKRSYWSWLWTSNNWLLRDWSSSAGAGPDAQRRVSILSEDDVFTAPKDAGRQRPRSSTLKHVCLKTRDRFVRLFVSRELWKPAAQISWVSLVSDFYSCSISKNWTESRWIRIQTDLQTEPHKSVWRLRTFHAVI